MGGHDEQIDSFLKNQLDKTMAEISRLCAQPSVSATGEGITECAELVATVLAEHGMDVERFDQYGNPVLVGRLAGKSDRTLMFYCHYDVQPPEPLDLWETPPFEPNLRDGKLYARGAKDDKGELGARLAAVDAVKDANGGELPCHVVFVVEGQEEVGSPHMVEFVRDNKDKIKADAAIWEEGGLDPDGRPNAILGARGLLYVELSVQLITVDAHSGFGSILPSSAWRLVHALHSLKDTNERVLIPGFYDAAKKMTAADLELIAPQADFSGYLRNNYGVKQFVRGADGKDLNYTVFEPTCNIAGIGSGYQGDGVKTVIPAAASAKIDFRLVPDQDPEDIFKKLRQHLDDQGYGDVEVKKLGTMWPHKTAPDDPFVKLIDQAAVEVYGQEPLNDPLMGGSTPMYAFSRPLGNIPVALIGVGHGPNQTHAPNEWVGVEDVLNASRQIARVLDRFAG